MTLSLAAAMALGAVESRAQGAGPGIGTPLVPGTTTTNSRVGTRGANFLEIGLGARAMGMAGAYSALAEGLPALYWNLAGAAEVSNVAGGVSYAQLYGKDGLDFIWGGAILPLAGGAVGIQIGQMSSGDMDRTSYDFPEGGDLLVGNTFTFSSTMGMLSYSRRLTDRLAVGVGAKYATEGISNARARWFGADVGLRFRTGLYGTTIGAALANVGSSGRYEGTLVEDTSLKTIPGTIRVRYRTEDMEMPTMFRFSVMTDLVGGPEALLSQAATAGSLRAVGEFANAIDTDLQGALGVEYSYRNIVFLRGGKRWLNEADSDFQGFERGLAFGGGIRLPVAGRSVQFDYAWNGQGELPNTNHFGFEFGF